MLKQVALRIGARLLLDWTSWAAIALAVVLAHSGFEHLHPDAELLRHYAQVTGMPGFCYLIGVAQLLTAAALLWRRTRSGACAALAAMLLLAMAHQIADGRAGEGLLSPFALLILAVAIAAGERRFLAQPSRGIRA